MTQPKRKKQPDAVDPRRISSSAKKVHVTGPRAVQPLKIWRPPQFKDLPGKSKREKTLRWGVCMNVVDGDTYDFWVENGLEEMPYKRVRLRAVDAPSIESDASPAEQALGQKAKARAAELMLNQLCFLDFGTESQIYGRFLAAVTVYIAGLPHDFGGILIAEHLTVADVVRV